MDSPDCQMDETVSGEHGLFQLYIQSTRENDAN